MFSEIREIFKDPKFLHPTGSWAWTPYIQSSTYKSKLFYIISHELNLN